MDEDSQFQDILRTTIEILGFNKRSIENRRAFMKEMTRQTSQLCEPDLTIHSAGSKAEGMTLCLENDLDFMYVLNDVVCVEIHDCSGFLETDVMFEMVLDKQFPGYTKLVLIKMDKDLPLLTDALVDDDKGGTFVSSDIFANTIQSISEHQGSKMLSPEVRSGPSCPATLQMTEYSFAMDRVFCFRCVCPTFLRKWSQRKRYQIWPTSDMIAHVNSLDAHVVPVGVKGYMLQFSQWRICFTLGETYLLGTLNENMLQVYAIMKDLIRVAIKPVCKDVTSYIAKNIILWMAETLPTDRIDIVPLLMKAILILKLAVKAEYLPSYMIPDRNLLQNKISLQQKNKLDVLLSTMLEERGAMVLRSPRIGREMCFVYSEPERLEERRKTYKIFTTYPSLPQDILLQQSLPLAFQKHNANEEFSMTDFLANNPVVLREIYKSTECLNNIQQFLRLPYAQNICQNVMQRIPQDSNVLDGLMKLPLNTVFKAMEAIGFDEDFLDLLPENAQSPELLTGITLADVVSREDISEMIDPNTLSEFLPLLPTIVPKLMGCIGTDETNSLGLAELASTVMNHPDTRNCTNSMMKFAPYSRYMRGK